MQSRAEYTHDPPSRKSRSGSKNPPGWDENKHDDHLTRTLAEHGMQEPRAITAVENFIDEA